MPIMFRGTYPCGLAVAALVSITLAGPSKAQLPHPVPGKRFVVRRSNAVSFHQLVAREQAQPTMFRQMVAVHEPLRIAGRLTELEAPEIKREDGSDEEQDGLRGSNAPAPTQSFIGIVDNINSIPPDTQGAVGPNHVMTILNSQVQIQDKTGVIKYGPVSLAGFVAPGLASGASPFDPHLSYDAATGHWIAVVGAYKSGFTDSRLLLGISATSDPTGNWWFYSILTDSGANFSDYPTLGISGNWITVAVNKFAVSSGSITGFTKATIFAFTRSQAETGAALTYFAWDDTRAFTINPAVTYDSGVTTQYMADDQSAIGNQGVLRISTISGSVTNPGYTAGAYTITPSNSWQDVGGDAGPQSGSTYGINLGDSRIINSVYRNGSLWGTHTVGLPSTGANRVSVQWWQISSGGQLQQFGRVDDPTATVFRAFPSIAVNSQNDVLVGYARFSPTTFASAAYSYHGHSDAANTMQAEGVVKAGEAPYYKTYGGGRNRWGDYSATVVDPSDDLSFWSVQEYATTPTTSYDRWSTWWVKVPTAPSIPQSLTLNPTTILGGHNGLGIVTMSAPTTAATTVTLSSTNTAVVNFPLGTTLTVARGATTAHFAFKAYNVTSSTPVTISATATGTTVMATETVAPLGLLQFLVSPSSVEGGAPTALYIYLTGAAKTGGYSVTLTNSNPGVVSAPTTILIPAGASAVAIPLDTNLVAKTTTITFTATAGGTTLTSTLTLVP